jgi:hypothetical protein
MSNFILGSQCLMISKIKSFQIHHLPGTSRSYAKRQNFSKKSPYFPTVKSKSFQIKHRVGTSAFLKRREVSKQAPAFLSSIKPHRGRYGVFSTDVNFLASGLFGRSYLYLLHNIFFLKGILLRKWPKNIIKIRWIIISLQKKRITHVCIFVSLVWKLVVLKTP